MVNCPQLLAIEFFFWHVAIILADMRVCGMDEVGRGSLAGPLVAAAAVLKCGRSRKFTDVVYKLKDSKKLTRRKREQICLTLLECGIEYRVEIISARQINNRGIGWANKEIFRRLIKKIPADKYIVDGNLRILAKSIKGEIKSVVKADNTRKCVMAAAIIAKVFRDDLMRNLHGQYPRYGWSTNAGYGTQQHIEAIKEFGTVKYHRDVYVESVLKNIAR